jgi:hypothetical protein
MKKVVFAFEDGTVFPHWCNDVTFHFHEPHSPMSGITIEFKGGGTLGIPDQVGELTGISVNDYDTNDRDVLARELRRVIEYNIKHKVLSRDEMLSIIDAAIVFIQ